MKTQKQKVEQLNRIILTILSTGSNSVKMGATWAKLVKLRSELKDGLQ